MQRLQAVAARMVIAHWAHIERVAAALQTIAVIDGSELDALIKTGRRVTLPVDAYYYPRIGEKLAAYEPHEVRRIIVGNYEMRYEIAAGTIFILRLWHCRENRSFEADE